jgi:Arabinose-binding domain of AraC transcription regulator, N-term
MAARTTAAVWVKGIAEMLATEGLDVGSLFAATGIDVAALDGPGARLPTERISQLWELAVARSGNPALALAQHQVARPASFDVVGYAMMSCADLRCAFERLIRYMLILSDALTMTMEQEAGGDRVTFVLFGGDRPIPRQRIEFICISVIGFCRWISRRDIHPAAVEFAYPAPADPALYREAFRCPVVFNAPRHSILFARADMAAPLPTSNPLLAELHERFAGDYLRQFDHAQTSYRVREVIVRRLPDGEPRRDEVAASCA